MKLPTLFKKPRPLELSHTEFGRLVFDARGECWVGTNLNFWGFSGLELVVDAPPTGPSGEQATEYRRIVAAQADLLPRCIAALQALAGEPTDSHQFVLSGIHIPRLDGTPEGDLANLWFDRVGDDHHMYGVQSSDRWQTLFPFADD